MTWQLFTKIAEKPFISFITLHTVHATVNSSVGLCGKKPLARFLAPTYNSHDTYCETSRDYVGTD